MCTSSDIKRQATDRELMFRASGEKGLCGSKAVSVSLDVNTESTIRCDYFPL